MSRQRAESMLKGEDKEGCFVVRNSSTKGLYTLSLFTKIPHPQVHTSYMIRKRGFFYSFLRIVKVYCAYLLYWRARVL